MPEEKEKERQKGIGISRRNFLKGMGTGAVAATVAPTVLVGAQKSAEAQMGGEISRAKIKLDINNKMYEVEVEPRTTLLSVLRDGFDTMYGHSVMTDPHAVRPILTRRGAVVHRRICS